MVKITTTLSGILIFFQPSQVFRLRFLFIKSLVTFYCFLSQSTKSIKMNTSWVNNGVLHLIKSIQEKTSERRENDIKATLLKIIKNYATSETFLRDF